MFVLYLLIPSITFRFNLELYGNKDRSAFFFKKKISLFFSHNTGMMIRNEYMPSDFYSGSWELLQLSCMHSI